MQLIETVFDPRDQKTINTAHGGHRDPIRPRRGAIRDMQSIDKVGHGSRAPWRICGIWYYIEVFLSGVRESGSECPWIRNRVFLYGAGI